MAFHRLTTPTYFGGLIGGQDYLNTPSDPSVGGSGVPAVADGKKTGGPNDGTYFVAFGEDGRSSFVNRVAKALAQNTDAIDDILRTSIPVSTFVDATAAGAVTTVALTGQIWVGETGTANNQANRDKIVRVTDQNNNDLEVNGTKIVAVLIHDGAAANVVGTQASGFRTNASVNFTPSIPNTTTYRVWYGIRDNYGNISAVNKGALFREQLRTINNVAGEVRALLRQVHSELAVNQAWDSAFDSTIRSLASAGLNERYRRARLQPAGFVTGDFDVAGGGAVITRDGQAVTVRTPSTNTSTAAVAWPDKNLASYKAEESAAKSVIAGFTAGIGGDFGYWHESEFKSYNTSGVEVSRVAPAGAGFMEVVPRDVRVTTTGGNNIYTRINDQADATLNPDSSGSQPGLGTIECAAGQFFALTGPTRTALRVGLDLIEVTFPGGAVQTYVVDSMLTATRILVCSLRGVQMSFGGAAVTGVRIRWIQTTVRTGGFHTSKQVGPVANRVMTVIAPSVISDDPTDELIGLPALFAAVSDEAGNLDRTRALEWGAQQLDGAVVPRGRLTAEGGVYGTVATFTGAVSVDDLVVADDASIGDDLTVGSDLSVANQVTTLYEVVERPELYYVFDEEFLHVQQFFLPDDLPVIQTTDHLWEYNEVIDIFTVNNGANSAKNPGQLEVIGAGGNTSRRLAIYLTSLQSFSFANLQSMTVIASVNDNPANLLTNFTIGLRSTATGGGTNVLSVGYFVGIGWCVYHVAGGVSGAHNFQALGAQVNDVFVVIRLLRNVSNGIDIYFNGTLITTVTSGQMPTGLATLSFVSEQGAGDANACIFTIDRIYLRQTTSANRAGL